MKIFSNVTTWVLLPLFVPVYTLLLVLFVPSSQDFITFNIDNMYMLPIGFKMYLLFQYTMFSIVIPGVGVLVMKRWNIISDVEIEDRKERYIPMVVTLVSCLMLYGGLTFQLQEVVVPKYTFSLALSGVVIAVAFLIFNMWKKISIHAAGMGIMFGFLLAYVLNQAEYQLWILALALICSGAVMTARLYLNKHSMSEVVIGWLLGSFLTFVVNFYA